MKTETIRLRRAALGCVLDALPKWQKTGVRIANHQIKVNGEHREWLTIFRKDGSLILWEHFPDWKLLGQLSATDIGRGGQVSTRLVQKLNALFQYAAAGAPRSARRRSAPPALWPRPGHWAGDDVAEPRTRDRAAERRRHQRLRIGVLRVGEYLLRRAALHHLPILHDDHLVGHGAHDREVVADEEIGEAVRLLQAAQELHDLLLHRAVERRSRLVEHHHLRLQDHRAGDRDPLPLAAGEFVRKAVAHRRVELHLLKRLDGAPVALGARQLRLMHEQPLGDDLADGQPRRQRPVGVLEDDLQLAPEPALLLEVERASDRAPRNG